MIPESPYAHFIKYGIFEEASEWRIALSKLEKDKPGLWDIFLERQTTGDVHQDTKNFPIIWNGEPSSVYSYFEHLLEPLRERLFSFFGNGFFRKLFVTRHFPKTIIFPHRDMHPLFRNCHRWHIPLYTPNSTKYGNALFNIGYIDQDDPTRYYTESFTSTEHKKEWFSKDITKRWISETVPMCVDEIWEINNNASDKNLQHNVINFSYTKDKIHIIMDWRQENFVSSFGKKPLDRDRETIK